MNYIEIKNLKLKVKLGITQEERNWKQLIYINLKIYDNFEEAFENDSIENTINYSEIVSSIKDILERKEFNLIEYLAQNIIINLKKKFNIEKIEIKIKKPNASSIADYCAFKLTS